MKSKQELIEEWESAIEAAEFYGKGKEERLISYMKDFVSDLNQLDEPDEREQLEIAYKDILSRREFWFDDKRYVVVEKPTVPQIVAEWHESEETEVKKDIEWLKEEILKQREMWKISVDRYDDDYLRVEDSYDMGSFDALVYVLNLFNQLDEPEVLSQEWMKDNQLMKIGPEGVVYYVPVENLQNLLVPKQELPVIPKFVAEWIEDNKQFEEKWNDYSKEDAMSDTIHFTIYGLFADYPATNSHVELRKPVLKWLSVDRGNYFKLVNAVRYGYEVEEEQKYVVRTNLGTYLILDMSKREWDYTSIPPQDDDIQYAYKFDDRSMAEGIAKLVEGKVEELD